jgi:hypothetical protein
MPIDSTAAFLVDFEHEFVIDDPILLGKAKQQWVAADFDVIAQRLEEHFKYLLSHFVSERLHYKGWCTFSFEIRLKTSTRYFLLRPRIFMILSKSFEADSKYAAALEPVKMFYFAAVA